MKKNKKLLIGIGIVALIGMVLIGAYRNRHQNDSVDRLRVGVVVPMTGATGYIGNSIQKGLELGKQIYGENLPIDLIYEDSQGKPSVAMSAYSHVHNIQKCQLLISGGSAVAHSLLPVTERDEVLHIATAVASEGFPKQGRHCVRLFLSAEGESRSVAEFCFEKLRCKTAAVVFVDDDFGQSYNRNFSERFESLGGKIYASEGFQKNEVDFKLISARLNNCKADVVYVVSNSDSQGHLIRQIKAAGWKNHIVTLLTITKDENIRGAGDAIHGVYYGAADLDVLNPHEYQRVFVDRFKSKYGQNPDAYACFAFDIMHFICEAAKNGDYTSSGIESEIRRLELQCVMGKVKLDSNGDHMFSVKMVQIP